MTTDDREPLPLWRVMHRAYDESAPPGPGEWTNGCGYAAEIRALRDWLVPEEAPPHRGMRPGGSTLTHQETLSMERQRLRALLTAEAERAEKGQ